MSSPTKDSERVETTEEALFHLQQIDELLNNDSDDDQGTIADYLKSDHDLTSALRRHDAELRDLCDRFIQVHVDEAENICRVYKNYCACEDQLVDFETEIVSFQRKLDEAANDVVMMQQQTDLLVRSITNRRQVSNKVNEVYDALQECDAFCEEISNKDVDINYLTNLRELEHKLSFLSKNKALQNSAVDLEIRPKLTAAAHKAGDKLQRFLSKKIAALAENPASLDQQQQELEQSAQFAFSFLQSYNQPVAREIVKLYVRTTADVFYKQFRSLVHDLSEASEIHAHPLDPIVTAEELSEIISNRDSGSPPGNQVAMPPASGFTARTLARRERSVSQHMRGFTDMLATTSSSSAPLRTLRESTFDDTVRAVSSIGVRHGKLRADPATAAQLDQCNSWTWQFAKCIQTLVNTCVAECRFIGNFFCLVDEAAVDLGENFADSERIARAVLGKAIGVAETCVQEDLPMVMARAPVLAALRIVEMAKQFLCTSQDPIPLVLLSGVLEMSKACLRNNLRTALRNDQAAMEYLPGVKLCSFRQAPPVDAGTAKLLESRTYAATLGPHPLLLRIGEQLGQLELLNNATFSGALFSRTGASTEASSTTADAAKASSATRTSLTAFDPFVFSFVESALKNLLDFTAVLSARHGSRLGGRLFASVNTYCVLASWTGMATRFLGGAGRLAGELNTAALPAPPLGSEADSQPSRPGVAPAPGTPAAAVVTEEMLFTALSESHVRCIEDRLNKALSAWVEADTVLNNTFGLLFQFAAEVEGKLGASLSDPARQGLIKADTLPASLSESQTLAVAAAFNGRWQDGIKSVTTDTTRVVQASLGAVSAGRSNALVQQRCAELTQRLVHAYLQTLADANAKLNSFATVLYGGNNELQAKLVSNTTMLHEVGKAMKA